MENEKDQKTNQKACQKEPPADKLKRLLIKVRNLIILSAGFIVVISICSMIYGRIVAGFFTLSFVFPAIFLVGAIIIMIGIVIFIVPVRPRLKDNKLIDHTTFASAAMERREKKRAVAYDALYLGITIILLASVVQLLLSFIIT